MNTDTRDLTKSVTQLRIIVLSLVMGVVAFAALVAFMVSSGQVQPQPMELVTYLGLGLLGVMLVLQFVVLPAMEANGRRRIDAAGPDPRPWLQLYTVRTIIGCALLEGAAFVCILGTMLDGRPIGLIAGLVGAALMLLLHFPTEDRVRAFVERQQSASTSGA